MEKIPFNVPFIAGTEVALMQAAINSGKMSGDGDFTKQSSELLKQQTDAIKVLLTTSCTHALELAALLIGIQPEDEVIMSSYTFVSTANPFVLRGAKVVYVDVHPETMNIDETLIEGAITPKTKAIVPVHYGGVACEMDIIMDIARRNDLFVIEDAAQGIGATYRGKSLGTIGDLGALSFHDTKNLHCGEGGALIINNPTFAQRAEIIREKGTNRARFLRGEVDKYTWVDVGSSYLPSELNAAFLLAQLQELEKVTIARRAIWSSYRKLLTPLSEKGHIQLSEPPESSYHNGHLFYIKCDNLNKRQDLIDYLKQIGIYTVFHYIPLHSAKAGYEYGRFYGDDKYTTSGSEQLLRLPMWVGLEDSSVNRVVEAVEAHYV